MLDKDFLINRICSGSIALEYNGKIYFYTHPSYKRKYKANLKYNKIIESSDEVLSVNDMLYFGNEWNSNLQTEVDTHIPKVLENLKVEIYLCYKNHLKTKIPELVEKVEKVKARLFELLSIKHRYDEFTVEGRAAKERTLYLLKKCTKNIDIPPEFLLNSYNSSIITEEDIREVARSGDWLIKWNAIKKGCKVFSNILTDEQERLVRWTTLYENILEASDSPPDEVIEDDYAFDGYLIWRQRERDREKGLAEVDKILGKNKGANEVYLPARDFDHAKEINSLNNPEALKIKRDRFNLVDEKGVVKESQFADKQLEIMLAKNRLGR